MKASKWRQSKRDKEITIELKIDFYELHTLVRSLNEKDPIQAKLLAQIELISEEAEEPAG